MLLLKGGKIVVNDELIRRDILIDSDKIIDISYEINGDYPTIRVDDFLLTPGLVDVHVHLREPGYEYKETIKSGTLSAAKGGVTTLVAMPNLNPIIDNEASIKKELEIIKNDALVNVIPASALSISQNSKKLIDVDKMLLYTKIFSDDGKGFHNKCLLKKALKWDKNIIIASHAEDKKLKSSKESEIKCVEREIKLLKDSKVKYHFYHISCRESIGLIMKAKKLGFNLSFEVAPHHFSLCDEDIKNANYKMNPPLRSKSDMVSILEAFRCGYVDMIATDHAPHSEEEKDNDYDKALNGIIGLETLFPLAYTKLVLTNIITISKLLELLIYNPGKRFELPYNKLAIGEIANIACFDINNKHEYRLEDIKSKSKNSPFIGQELYGFNKCTIFKGKVIYKEV